MNPSRLLCSLAAFAVLAPTLAGARPAPTPTVVEDALVGARVIVRPGVELASATVLVRDGVIVAVGETVRVPPGARVRDVSGMVIHAGFIDPWLGLSRLNGKEKPAAAAPDDDAAPPPPPAAGPMGSAAGSGHDRVLGEVRAVDWLAPDTKAVEALRAQGFAAACVVPDAGIVRGRDVVISLGSAAPGASVLADGDAIHAAFEAGGWRSRSYPGSVMGATALIRQALLDADWYRRARKATRSGPARVDEDASLEALGQVVPERRGGTAPLRLAFACEDVLDVLRARELADEAGARLRVRAAGDEYRRLAEVVAGRMPLAVPVTFPPVPRVEHETEWLDVSDETLRHWHRAPDNPRWLKEAGASVSLTTDGLKDVGDFTERVRRSIARGLPAADALAMVTTEPARQLGLQDRLGSVEPGRLAHLVVATGRPFEEGTEIREVWVDGTRHVVSRAPDGPTGAWRVAVTAGARRFEATLDLSAEEGSLSWEADAGGPGSDDPASRKAAITAVRREGATARFEIGGKPFERDAAFAATARVVGDAIEVNAAPILVAAGKRKPKTADKKPGETPPAPEPAPAPVGGPLSAGDVLLRGATVWTSAEPGVLTGADILVRDGRIAAVGAQLAQPRGVAVVDLSGRHVTPGLIDAHNHSAIVGGVNEGTESCTAQVRIGDVLNSETVDIYRQLAGGLTAANLLHGSANCMGGQSQVIRLKWGEPPQGLKFRGAWPMIKFALGENVKQSNWGDEFTTRYPQSRMGVEQFMREKFQEARDWDEHFRAKPERGKAPPRRDLQLECLAEILRGERKVHCHSYRQDEILGLIHVAEDFGFRVGTFQHVLEGYKVADEIARHGAGASSFTDWWAYKFEVYDAIPHNPALMWKRGVLTTVNSDSTELARRMQLEAAKAVKWGGVPETEALKFVTINAARQLGVDAMVGSIEPGKDADFAIWSGDPLSPASRCESTWIQGVKYFDREIDLAARPGRAAERERLIELARKARGESSGGEAWSPSYLQEAEDCMHVAGVARGSHP